MPHKIRPQPKLGSNLEWHGAAIRVVVKVPPSRRKAVGKANLKESLGTSSPAAAEALKWPVIARLKALAKGTKGSALPETVDTVRAEAAKFREMMAAKPRFVDPERWADPNALDERAVEIETSHGEELAGQFYRIAHGVETPLALHIDHWLSEADVSPRTVEKWRKSIEMLTGWGEINGVALSIEAVDRKTSADFVSDRMIRTPMHPETANSYLTGLRAYWTWLVNTGRAAENPWKGLSRPKAKASTPSLDKRPFTDGEARILLNAIQKQPLRDLCFIAAFSGMRLSEISELRVSHVEGGAIRLRGTKTKAARRLIPIHSELASIFSARMKYKSPDAFIIHELPDQRNPARPRSAPMTQAFTYARRTLGVDEREEGVRQSGVDFHSWRRWFIRKAADALDRGATGFNQWTIAEVVGHSKGDGPLAMTMGRYAGDTASETLKRCVESVRPPTANS
jgi:integrase